tara:strand:+ start:22 stop:606 length:585 start_codon:yes stop_codon:yes gene_type:complete
MDINYLIGLLILLALGLLAYSHYEHLSNEITYVKCKYDGNEYLVRNLPDKEDAACLLGKIRMKLEKIVESMKEKYPNDKAVLRMDSKFNSNNISESGKSNQYTSYSVNKGEKIVFCIRQKDENESLIDENTITFVAIHELAHVMTKSIGHTPEFWDNFKRLLNEAININVYEKVDYSKDPKEYCGIKVTDSPLY